MPTVLWCRSRVGRRMNSRRLLGPKKHRQAARQRRSTSASVCSATWSASTPEALVTMMSDSTTDGHQAMVQPGGRRLNPPQPAAADHRRPRRSAPWRGRRRCRPAGFRRRSAPARRRPLRPAGAAAAICVEVPLLRPDNKGQCACDLTAGPSKIRGTRLAGRSHPCHASIV